MLLDSDRNRLWHMLAAGEEAISYTQPLSKAEFDAQRITQHAVIRCIEILGEAASRISNNTRDQYREIPWSNIIGMRNRLVHAYFDIDLDLVWQTVTSELPSLTNQIIAILDREHLDS